MRAAKRRIGFKFDTTTDKHILLPQMHTTLFVVEVLLETFAYLKPSGSASEKLLSRRSLAALAATCKHFHEPAMDLLWEDMDDYGITPLLACVPRLYPLVYVNGQQVRAYSHSLFFFLTEHLNTVLRFRRCQTII
jgi:hypothetical protein